MALNAHPFGPASFCTSGMRCANTTLFMRDVDEILTKC